MAAMCPVFENAAALDWFAVSVTAERAADMVDHTEPGPSDDGGIRVAERSEQAIPEPTSAIMWCSFMKSPMRPSGKPVRN